MVESLNVSQNKSMEDEALKKWWKTWMTKEDQDLIENLNRDLRALILDKAEGDITHKNVQSVKRN